MIFGFILDLVFFFVISPVEHEPLKIRYDKGIAYEVDINKNRNILHNVLFFSFEVKDHEMKRIKKTRK